jgi:hypothetical protein
MCVVSFKEIKDLFGDSFWLFLYQIYAEGLVYNFHHLISLKQLEDFNMECYCFI